MARSKMVHGLLLAAFACGGMACEQKATTTAPAASGKAAAKPAATGTAAATATGATKPAATPAADQPDFKAMNDKLAALFDTTDECDAVAEKINKFADDNKADIKKMKEWEKTASPEDKKKFDPSPEAQEKAGATMKRCLENKSFEAAMDRLDDPDKPAAAAADPSADPAADEPGEDEGDEE